MTRQISKDRKSAYYLGTGLMILGGILLAAVFVTAAVNFGNFSNINSTVKFMSFLFLGGMALMIIGVIVRGIGARGLAGSGVVLDPERARQELEPYSRMAGGMVKDALAEANVNPSGKRECVVMLKCHACDKLNEETSKFCQECGKKI